MKNRSLAFKLVALILSGTAVVFLSAFAYYFLASKKSVMKNVEENAKNLTRSTVYRIETVLHGVEKVPLNISIMMGLGRLEMTDLPQLLDPVVLGNPDIYGFGVFFEPYASDKASYYFGPYSCRDGKGGVTYSMLGDDSYQYFTMDWYQIPKELNRPAWAEPYFDEGGGNIIMTTFSAPFYKKIDGIDRFQGVVGADMDLSHLAQIVSAIKLYRSGYAFLISRAGEFVTHPDSSLIMRHTIFSIAEEKGSALLRKVGQDMIHGGEGLAVLDAGLLSKGKSWLYYAPLVSTGWSLGIVIPQDELLADVNSLGRRVVAIGVTGLAMMALIVWLISHRITKPLKALVKTTVEIAQGNLDAELPDIRSRDEIGRLADSFETMRLALKEYVRHITETTAAREKIESELKIARNIQMSFLPKMSLFSSEREGFDIYAKLEPAREIGGDLYDFFRLGPHHLFFTVGDVSDKGIAAALFMAMTKTLMKGIAESGMDASEILERTNVELCRDNESMMFVTVFCGIIDLQTGILRYSNAGHSPPLLIRQGKEEPEWLDIPPGFVLGAMDDAQFHTMETRLGPGDMIVIYTDGVTEAMDAEGALYSDERLMDLVRSGSFHSAEAITRKIFESVKQYSSEVPQTDDITLLTFTSKAYPGTPSP